MVYVSKRELTSLPILVHRPFCVDPSHTVNQILFSTSKVEGRLTYFFKCPVCGLISEWVKE